MDKYNQANIEKVKDYLALIIDIGFDYDGFESSEDLKGIIDELVGYARDGLKHLYAEEEIVHCKDCDQFKKCNCDFLEGEGVCLKGHLKERCNNMSRRDVECAIRSMLTCVSENDYCGKGTKREDIK